MRYLANRWSSPWEWGIVSVPDDVPLGEVPDEPAMVFETFTQAKDWLIDQTRVWVSGFSDDMRGIRSLRKDGVQPERSAYRIKEVIQRMSK